MNKIGLTLKLITVAFLNTIEILIVVTAVSLNTLLYIRLTSLILNYIVIGSLSII